MKENDMIYTIMMLMDLGQTQTVQRPLLYIYYICLDRDISDIIKIQLRNQLTALLT